MRSVATLNIQSGQFFHRKRRFTLQLRGSSKCGDRARTNRLKYGEYLGAQAIARVLRSLIRRIFNPYQAPAARTRLNLMAAKT
jgi:hypothetical protein